MLYISLLLWSDYINNAGKASVQHNEIIFLISVDSYGNSLANNLLHHQWPQITAVFKNLGCSWKLRRLITWTERDRKMCQKLLWLKLLTLSCSLFFPRTLKVDVQSRSHLTWVQTIMSGASKQTIVLQREFRSGSAPKPSETGMGAVKVGWRCLCGPPDWGDGSWGGWAGLLPCPVRVLQTVLHPWVCCPSMFARAGSGLGRFLLTRTWWIVIQAVPKYLLLKLKFGPLHSWLSWPLMGQLVDLTGRHLQIYKKIPEEKCCFLSLYIFFISHESKLAPYNQIHTLQILTLH